MVTSNLPLHSRSEVNQAGRRVRKGIGTEQDFEIIDNWRASHAHVLNAFQTTLRNKGTEDSVIVQRLKRLPTIVDKLRRRPGFSLTEMQDIAGCRVIVPTIADVWDFRARFLRSRISHKHLTEDDRYNYITNPKPDGYRSVHEVFAYNSRKVAGAPWEGLRVELQFRTNVQHAWSTAVEVAGFLTENDPKFGRGSPLYSEFFVLASELLARHFEQMPGPMSTSPQAVLVNRMREIEAEVGILTIFRRFNRLEANDMPQVGRDVVLLIRPTDDVQKRVQLKRFDSFSDALRTLGDFERHKPGDARYDVVVVRNVAGGFLTNAYRNYFTDTKDFVQMIDTCLS